MLGIRCYTASAQVVGRNTLTPGETYLRKPIGLSLFYGADLVVICGQRTVLG